MIAPRTKTRVLVVDDSAVVRLILRRMIEAAGFEVVGTAVDGADAVEQAVRTQPDVITLDVQMPGMNGLEALEELTKRTRASILMVSSLTRKGAEVTLAALEKGAFDYIPKTNGLNGEFERELVRKLRLASSYAKRLKALPRPEQEGTSFESAQYIPLPNVRFRGDGNKELVVIGSSTGGPRVLTQLLSKLPEDFPLAILVVQHMPPTFTRALAERLDRDSPLRVREAQEGDTVTPGHVFVAPGGKQMTVHRTSAGRLPEIRIRDGEISREIYAPSIDITLLSVAEAYPGPCLGILLTGMGNDGRRGMQAIKEAGGVVVVQDRKSCTVSGMVRACLEAGIVDAEVPPFYLAEVVQRIVGGL